MISLFYVFWDRLFDHFYMFFYACLDMRAAVVATLLLFTDVRFTWVKHRFVTTLALNRHYYFIGFFSISSSEFDMDFCTDFGTTLASILGTISIIFRVSVRFWACFFFIDFWNGF